MGLISRVSSRTYRHPSPPLILFFTTAAMNALEVSALERKERLKKYRQQVQRLDKKEEAAKNGEVLDEAEKDDEIIGFEEEVSGPMLKLRNYKPHDEQFKDSNFAPKKPEKIESQIKSQLAGNDNEADNDEIGLDTLQPRKVDWDLKRDLNAKLSKLERQTSKALMQMLRDRLAPSQEEFQTDNPTDKTNSTENSTNADNNSSQITSGITGDRYAGMLP